MKRLAGIGFMVVLIVAGGVWAFGGIGEDTGAGWVSVDRDDLVLGVEVSGTLQSVETDKLGPPQLRDTWQFKIARLAPEGDDVEAGTPVLVFDSSELQQRLQREMAERDAAHKRLEKAEKETTVSQREAELRLAEAQGALRKASMKADTPEELEKATELASIRLDKELAEKEVAYLKAKLESTRRSAEATMGALRSQFSQAEQRVEGTQRDIEQMTRTAPRAGTVIYVKDWRDEAKKVGDSCWRGESVIELPNLSEMKAQGQVHEADAGKIAVEQSVSLRLDAHPDVEFSGKVASIWRTVQRESWRSPLKVVRLEIELGETDTQRMRPGMRFRGEIVTERVEDALVVDIASVFLEPEGPVVYRKKWRGFDKVPVELGRRNKNVVEVLSGLEQGDEISQIDRGGRRSDA
jgi:multidrug efflux pump subunit AcrA (membrane-fusion protein)